MHKYDKMNNELYLTQGCMILRKGELYK